MQCGLFGLDRLPVKEREVAIGTFFDLSADNLEAPKLL